MLIDFLTEQQKQFDRAAQAVLSSAERYLCFDSIADVYAAPWLANFPKAAQLSVSGLDDGAEQFCIRVQFDAQYMQIDYAESTHAVWLDRFGKKRHF
ncbi:hypothetical protein [Acinetobacter tianfuensis]|uniref:Uncharacterized protein n=1 Tax=Acinetobacter tianfuensis TaxID=2419603 RepID=A0A3A8EGK5_9GAMM|nr:hypothetical protein [Acinetobacter tianfuensis]RKG29900.1 hypothetical protein D7V32_13170 [Acinetobacter tianfuensis]